jgi:hypothetical protein
MAHPFDEFVACMEARGEQFGQVARDIGSNAFNGANDLAVDFLKATIAWWDSLDADVRRAVTFGASVAGALGGILLVRLATVIIDASGLAILGEAAGEVAAGLAAIAAGFAVGVFLAASAACFAEQIPA